MMGYARMTIAGAAMMAGAAALPAPAAAQEAFIGEVRTVGFNWCPRGWARMDGQLLPINQNQALFSLLGTTYGGDGRTTFALPDMRGRVALHQGNGPGLQNRPIGQTGGLEETIRPGVPVREGRERPNRPAQSEEAASPEAMNNMPPYVVLNWCIALQGIYPSRS
ncbi:phage tail protein [Sphingomicrobium arenosum]|uniref:phage tail protein n=1 Tax=Sphingomicrobium arenosum TaxID=2233861 RepID=UPI002240F786|nr:tail fiber protein [Sphingomicrobium arenosum]